MNLELFFSDHYKVTEEQLDSYGAFNISLVTDLPLFIDPFLLFNSSKPEYKQLHDHIIKYLRLLKALSERGQITSGALKSLYHFPEVKQNWFGFSETGNRGRGLGQSFANSLNKNLVLVFNNFGEEEITIGSHLEKLCLIKDGVGRDMISDFTTNLIKDYLLKYTESFSANHIDESMTAVFGVKKARFDYRFGVWMPGNYRLPVFEDDFVILTPKDILTKDEAWINQSDMINRFREIPESIDNESLREQVNNYFYSQLSIFGEPTKEEYKEIAIRTLTKYPALIDHYIKKKEDDGEHAVAVSAEKVSFSNQLYVRQFGELPPLLFDTRFYHLEGTTKEETRQKIEFLKDIIENKGGHHIFYINGEPKLTEKDLHILFRLTWHGTPSDVSREVDDGRGPADFKVSRGAYDKTLVEFKLAKNTHLKKNLQNQLKVYQKASDADAGYKVIIYFREKELARVIKILNELRMENDPNIYLIDARNDNKPSGSKA